MDFCRYGRERSFSALQLSFLMDDAEDQTCDLLHVGVPEALPLVLCPHITSVAQASLL